MKARESLEEFQPTLGLIVPKEKIAEDGDYTFSGERYREVDASLSEYPHVKLADIADINPDQANPSDLYTDYFNYIDISCVENETGKLLGANRTEISDAPSRARRLVKQDDVLLSTVRPNLKAFTILSHLPERAIASTGFAVLRAKEGRVLPCFLIAMLRHRFAVDQMIGMMGKGAYPSINQSDVEAIKIPLPPLEVQEEIVAEIEGYQKIIDGARAVVDNYRPHIPVDPDWPLAVLGEAADFISGYAFKSSDMTTTPYDATYRPVVKIGNIRKDGQLDMSDAQYHAYSKELDRFVLREGDIVMAMTGATVGKVATVDGEGYLLNQRVGLLRCKDVALQHYIFCLLSNPNFYSFCPQYTNIFYADLA